MVTRSPTCSAARTRRAASACESRSTRARTAVRFGWRPSRAAGGTRRHGRRGGRGGTCGCGSARTAAGSLRTAGSSRTSRPPASTASISWSERGHEARGRGRPRSPPALDLHGFNLRKPTDIFEHTFDVTAAPGDQVGAPVASSGTGPRRRDGRSMAPGTESRGSSCRPSRPAGTCTRTRSPRTLPWR